MKRYLMVILCLLLFACGDSDGDKPDGIEITYIVSSYSESCYDIAYVTYIEPGISYYNFKVHLPWSHSFYTEPGDYLYLSAKPGDMTDPNCIAGYELILTIEKARIVLAQVCTDPNIREIGAILP